MQRKINLTMIYASARKGRLRDRVADWLASNLFGEDGGALIHPQAVPDGARLMWEQRHWWVLTLRQGQAERNYGEIAA